MTAELFYWSLFALAVGVGMWGAVKQHGHTSIEDGGTLSLSSSSLADSAVTTAKLAADAVTTAKITDASVTGAKTLLPLFQCRLVYSDANHLTLNRFGGSWLFINGLNYQIPSSAPTLNVSGASASQLNYIYAYISGGAVTLEKSTTAYATDSTYGHLIKSGDATRTLVGLAYTTGSTQWADSEAQRFTRSYYNDPGITTKSYFTTTRSTNSTGYVELHSEIRNEFVVWAGETVHLAASGMRRVNSNSVVTDVSMGIDSANAEDTWNSAYDANGASDGYMPVGMTLLKSGLGEGYHYATLIGKVNYGAAQLQMHGGSQGLRNVLAGYTRRR